MNLKPPHIFAANPLDRGEVERRDEDWISQQAQDPASRFLPMRGPAVLVNAAATGSGEPALGWLGRADLEPHLTTASPLFLGLLEGRAYFVIDLSKDEPAGGAVAAPARLPV